MTVGVLLVGVGGGGAGAGGARVWGWWGSGVSRRPAAAATLLLTPPAPGRRVPRSRRPDHMPTPAFPPAEGDPRRSPSPEPVYDKNGVRLNTREIRCARPFFLPCLPLGLLRLSSVDS